MRSIKLNRKQADLLAQMFTHFHDINQFDLVVNKDSTMHIKFDILNTVTSEAKVSDVTTRKSRVRSSK